jgi:hypothetical protein
MLHVDHIPDARRRVSRTLFDQWNLIQLFLLKSSQFLFTGNNQSESYIN